MASAPQAPQAPRVGELIRVWRQRRKVSQFELSLEAAVSARHLSFIETGRSRPSREMVLHLADRLEVPLRERNTLLVSAGYAPTFAARSFDDPEMATVRETLDRLLAAHGPCPSVAVDRTWTIVAANGSLELLLGGVAPWLLEPPANGLRLTLHPEGMAPNIVNFPEWSGNLMRVLARRVALSGDAELARLHDELAGYPGVLAEPPRSEAGNEIALPLRLRRDDDELAFLCTQTAFGTAIDITLAELSLEAFYPADEVTTRVVFGSF
jgi:transcriptional regulator with XRE-family HTH domain